MRRVFIALTAIATLASLVACGSSPSGRGSDSQAATVNGTPVSLDSYNTLSTTLRQRIERQTGGSNSEARGPPRGRGAAPPRRGRQGRGRGRRPPRDPPRPPRTAPPRRRSERLGQGLRRRGCRRQGGRLRGALPEQSHLSGLPRRQLTP